jgi:hypothetical protein
LGSLFHRGETFLFFLSGLNSQTIYLGQSIDIKKRVYNLI